MTDTTPLHLAGRIDKSHNPTIGATLGILIRVRAPPWRGPSQIRALPGKVKSLLFNIFH